MSSSHQNFNKEDKLKELKQIFNSITPQSEIPKYKWYESIWLICLMAVATISIPQFSILILVIAYLRHKKEAKIAEIHKNFYSNLETCSNAFITSINDFFSSAVSELNNHIRKEKSELQEKINTSLWDLNEKTKAKEEKSALIDLEISKKDFYYDEIKRIKSELNDLESKKDREVRKIQSLESARKAINNALKRYYEDEQYQNFEMVTLPENMIQTIETYAPSVILKIHAMDYKDLNTAFKANDKIINNVLSRYEERYSTKVNKSIYQLMVIALRAELQNVLYTLTYRKLDSALADINTILNKYMNIAREGNQTISVTLARFIGEIEPLFIDAVKIEYEYYVKKEAARQEQLALREQMKLEAEERKRLKEEEARMEQEASKYHTEIENIQGLIKNSTDEEKNSQLLERIAELEKQLQDINDKKEEIINLQNGKAGYVYIISNLGSFGDDVFKIGMTRRLDPQDRINELGSASVPFKFDVHSFIFSEDAVKLEANLHEALNDKRLNKINLRKEFFKVSIDEIEQTVYKYDSNAEFNKTMQAEQYYQSLSMPS